MPNDGESNPVTCHSNDIVRLPDAETVAEAGRLIRQGALVAFPTETVYGLGGDATNGEAVARIFAAKGRPSFNPLIVHVLELGEAGKLGNFSYQAQRLAEAFWPGPLTLVVRRAANTPIADLASAGLPTLALRVPNHPVARAVLRAASCPIAAPSANRSGHVSATRADHVAADLGTRVAMILDGGPAVHGLESTVLDASTGSISLLRPGAVPVETIEAVLGHRLARMPGTSDRPASPGLLASHYATRAMIRLNVTETIPGEALLAFGTPPADFAGPVINLSPAGDLIEAAATLFSALRKLDASGVATIAVMPIPNHGLGEAINDRLRRAAAPRNI